MNTSQIAALNTSQIAAEGCRWAKVINQWAKLTKWRTPAHAKQLYTERNR